MFNFGWGELVLIGIVALIAIGPKELPTVLRTLGQALGKVRRMANEFQGQFQEALREADIADLKKHADEMTSSLNESVTDIASFDPMADTQKEIEQGFDMATPITAPETPAASADAAPAELPAPQTPETTLPAIDVPLPDHPPAVSEKDFAAVEPPATEAAKQAGGKA